MSNMSNLVADFTRLAACSVSEGSQDHFPATHNCDLTGKPGNRQWISNVGFYFGKRRDVYDTRVCILSIILVKR